jgi:CheY-like chemotaxis protein
MYNTSHHHIVIVDDNLDTRYFMNFSFREIHWDDNVKIIDSATQMLQYLEALSQTASFPALILLNNNLELVSCEEVMARLKSHSHYQNIPIVVYAHDMNESLKSKLMKLGAFSCHEKPSGKEESLKLAEYLKHLSINHCN